MGDKRELCEMNRMEVDVLPDKKKLAEEEGFLTGVKILDQKNEKDSPPADKYYLVYVILFLHGIGVLMPWNMFINANDYFVSYKLTVPDKTLDEEAKVYRDYFLSFLGIVSYIPSIILNFMNLFCQFDCCGSIAKRIVVGIVIIIFMFIVTEILAMVDSSTWPAQFFWITMVTVVIINMANGIYQNSIYGTAAFLPMKYTNAVIVGSNTSGLLTSVIAIIVYLAAPDQRTSAIYYFLTAIIILLVAFDTYFVLPLLPFFTHYKNRAKSHEGERTEMNFKKYMLKYWHVFRKCWIHDMCVFFNFFVTLTCFPAIQAGVTPSSLGFPLQKGMFTLVTCFLFFNLFAVLGSLTTEFFRKPGPRWVWLPILLRALFIPFFMLCNYKPESRSMPVWVNDYVYCFGGILLAYSSGYFSSLSMMYAPGNVDDKQKGIAGMMAANFLILGIFGGLAFSLPIIYMIENVGSYVHVPHMIANATASPLLSYDNFTTYL